MISTDRLIFNIATSLGAGLRACLGRHKQPNQKKSHTQRPSFGAAFSYSATDRESRQRAARACAIVRGRLTEMKYPGKMHSHPPRHGPALADTPARGEFLPANAGKTSKTMAEKREKIARISCKVLGGAPVLLELFPAEAWNDGPEGQVRLRVNGKMASCYYTLAEVGAVVAKIIGGEPLDMDDNAPPKVMRGQRISLPCEPFDKGEYIGIEGGFIESDDVVRGHDGRWYCIASGTTRRLGLVPIDDITFSRPAPKRQVPPSRLM